MAKIACYTLCKTLQCSGTVLKVLLRCLQPKLVLVKFIYSIRAIQRTYSRLLKVNSAPAGTKTVSEPLKSANGPDLYKMVFMYIHFCYPCADYLGGGAYTSCDNFANNGIFLCDEPPTAWRGLVTFSQ